MLSQAQTVTAIYREPFKLGTPIVRQWPAGLNVAEIVSRMNLPAEFQFRGTVMINGHVIPSDRWNRVKPLPNRNAMVTFHLPVQGGGGDGKQVIAIIAALAIAVLSAGIAGGLAAGLIPGYFAAGSASAYALAAGVSLAGSLLVSALTSTPTKQQNQSDGGRSLDPASITGNVLEPNAPVPRVIGTRRIFPPFATEPTIEYLGQDEIVHGIYCLAGPHELSEPRLGDTSFDIEANDADAEIQLSSGLPDAIVPSYPERYSRIFTAGIELSVHGTNAENLAVFEPPLPIWHGTNTADAPDEVWLHFLMNGLILQTNPTDKLRIPLRIRMRLRGDATWRYLPELHYLDVTQSQRRFQVKIRFGEAYLSTLPAPPSNRGFVEARKSVPAQNVTPLGAVWDADAYFSDGAGNDSYRNGTEGTTNVVNCILETDTATVYLDETWTPGIYEIEIKRGATIKNANYTPSTYAHSGSILDLFGSRASNAMPLSREGLLDRMQFVRSVSVRNDAPIRPSDMALIYVKARNRGVGNMSILASGYVHDWNGGNQNSIDESRATIIDFRKRIMRIKDDTNAILSRTVDPADFLTFERASTATYVDANGVIRTAGVDEMRFDHDPMTGEPLGLMMETDRTNVALQSGNMRVSPWSLVSTTQAIQGEIAPDENDYWTKIVETEAGSGTQSPRVSQNITIAADASCWSSVYLKKGTRKRALVQHFNFANWATRTYAVVDLETGTLVTVGGSGSPDARIEAGPNGSWRVSIYGVAASNTSTRTIGVGTRLDNATSDASYTGDGVSYILAWGMQVEVGTFPTSYIPTIGTAGNRAIETCYTSIASFPWDLSNATLLSECVPDAVATTFLPIVGVGPDGASPDSRIGNWISSANRAYSEIRNLATNGVDLSAAPDLVPGDILRSAFGWTGTTDAAMSRNGIAVLTDNSYTLPSDMTRFYFGSRANSAFRLGGHLTQIAILPRRMSDAELVQWSGSSQDFLELLAGDWTYLRTTSNPAPHYRDILSGLLNFDPLPDELHDDAALVAWRNVCEADGLTCDMIAEGTALAELLRIVASCGYARPYQSEIWGIIRDYDRSAESAVQVFSPRNSAEFRWTKAFPRLPDGIRVNFKDQAAEYTGRQIVVYREGANNPNARTEQISYEGLITREAVTARARFDLRQAQFRSVIYSFSAPVESIVCRRGSLVAVNHDVLLSQYGFARIVDVTRNGSDEITHITVDCELEISNNDGVNETANINAVDDMQTLGLQTGIAIRRNNGTNVIYRAVNAGLQTEIELETPTVDAAVVDGCLLVAGTAGKEYKRLIVSGIEPGQDLTANLTLVDEAPELWS